jgi:hypothetical protein
LLVFPSRVYKWSINPFSNPHPVYSHSFTWQYLISYILCVESSCLENSSNSVWCLFKLSANFNRVTIVGVAFDIEFYVNPFKSPVDGAFGCRDSILRASSEESIMNCDSACLQMYDRWNWAAVCFTSKDGGDTLCPHVDLYSELLLVAHTTDCKETLNSCPLCIVGIVNNRWNVPHMDAWRDKETIYCVMRESEQAGESYMRIRGTRSKRRSPIKSSVAYWCVVS